MWVIQHADGDEEEIDADELAEAFKRAQQRRHLEKFTRAKPVDRLNHAPNSEHQCSLCLYAGRSLDAATAKSSAQTVRPSIEPSGQTPVGASATLLQSSDYRAPGWLEGGVGFIGYSFRREFASHGPVFGMVVAHKPATAQSPEYWRVIHDDGSIKDFVRHEMQTGVAAAQGRCRLVENYSTYKSVFLYRSLFGPNWFIWQTFQGKGYQRSD
jgi:hypothetical protein